MKLTVLATLLAAGAGLGACAGYHQEVAALRMARPAPPPAELAAFAGPAHGYPSVDGDILRGTSPASAAAYDATVGDNPPPAPPVN